MRRFASLVSLLGIVGAMAPALAHADPLPSIDGRTWRPSAQPGAQLVLEPIDAPGPWQWSFGDWLSYAHHPFTLRDAGTGDVAFRPIEQQLVHDFTASVGLGERASIGIDLPAALYQNGDAPLPSTIAATGGVPQSAIGDLTIFGKGAIVPNETKLGGFGVAILGALTVPTGERASFLGEGSATASARAIVEYKYLVARLQASLGYALRTDHRSWPDPAVGGVTFGDSIPWSVALAFSPGGVLTSIDPDARQTWELGAHGSLPAGPVGPFGTGDPGSAQLSPVLLAVSDRWAIGHYKDWYALGGAEIGLNDAVGVPAFRVVASIGWAPREHDADHDGIPDDRDQCPEGGLQEDYDGLQDDDGCPEDDADNDGVVDREDRCPNVKGIWWNDPAKNGCPAADTDHDGIPDPMDACPTVPGIRRGNPKKNGCPREHKAADQDKDGVPDKDDACPTVAGERSPDPKKNGCPAEAPPPPPAPAPLSDKDGDTYPDDVDVCPDAAETFNGVKDDDGCPDPGGAPVAVVGAGATPTIALATPLAFAGTAEAPTLDAASELRLRAVARELQAHRDWTLEVSARPMDATPEAAKQATAKADLVARKLGELTGRPTVARSAPWAAGATLPAHDLAFKVVTAPPAEGPPR